MIFLLQLHRPCWDAVFDTPLILLYHHPMHRQLYHLLLCLERRFLVGVQATRAQDDLQHLGLDGQAHQHVPGAKTAGALQLLTPLPSNVTLAPNSVCMLPRKGTAMGQVHVHVTLTNYREALMARLGQLAPDQVHRYETEALIDTGAVRSAISAAPATFITSIPPGRKRARRF